MELRYQLFFIQLLIICFLYPLHGAAGKIKQAQRDYLPFVASIAYDNNKTSPSMNHFCTGTLISNKFILTAKHCIEEMSKTKCVIRIGCTKLRKCKKRYPKAWTTFKTWATANNKLMERGIDDLGVIELTEKVDNVKPAMLHSYHGAVQSGKKLYAAGWGSGDYGLRPNNLRQVSLQVLTGEECDKRASAYIEVAGADRNTTICTATAAPSGYAILRLVDSGGPLFDEEHRVVGIFQSINQTSK